MNDYDTYVLRRKIKYVGDSFRKKKNVRVPEYVVSNVEHSPCLRRMPKVLPFIPFDLRSGH
jgi:hypothetical protein